ncbi:MAG: hypothetical protein KBD01_20055 [Acidobacteria bacterium]|nr:hypothetical protein [Acidobacteriota bacterium]
MRRMITLLAVLCLFGAVTPSADQDDLVRLAIEHASQYGEPASYTAPAVFDTHVGFFWGHNLRSRLSAPEIVSAPVLSCGTAPCSGTTELVCISSPDPDADGTDEFSPGDVVYFGSAAPRGGTYLVRSIESSGPDCGGAYAVRLAPAVDGERENLRAGSPMTNAWRNSAHPTNDAYRMIGYRLGYGSRLRDGRHSPNLAGDRDLGEPAFLGGWKKLKGLVAFADWNSTPAVDPEQCWEGSAGRDCTTIAAKGAKARIQSRSWIVVEPDSDYVLSGYVRSTNLARVALELVSRKSGDSVVRPEHRLALPAGDGITPPGWFWGAFHLPGSVRRVKLRVTVQGRGAAATLDDLAFRRVTTWNSDGPAAPSVFLVNDPGSRAIVLTGDSWTVATEMESGLEAALSERFGRDFSTQVVSTGDGGMSAERMLDEFDARVASRAPLYAVFSVGNYEAHHDVPVDDFLASLGQLADRCAEHGVIPIFLSVAPVGDSTGPGSIFEHAHALRDGQRRRFLYE